MNDNISPRCPRILLAEDDPPSRKVTQLMFEKLGYKVDVVADGLEALKAMEDKTYDLLFMDIVMPKMDGLAAAAEIRRRWPESKQPRIIAYTAYIYHGNDVENLFKNMDGYLYKPIRIGDLRTAVEGNLRVLNRLKRNAQGSPLIAVNHCHENG